MTADFPPSMPTLAEIAEILLGQSPPSMACSEVKGTGLPFLQGNAEFTHRHPENLLYCSAPTRICEPNDILVSVRAPVGAVNLADQTYVIGRGLAAVRFPPELQPFGWHALRFWAPTLERVAQGTTFTAVGRHELKSLRIVAFGPEESGRIAAVLDAADEAVARTEAVIAKLKQMRAGLIHDLLTRGLDEHRQLREAIAQPEAFRATAAGVFPADWDVQPLGKVLSAVFDYRGRTPLKLGMEWGGGDIPALSANNVEMGRINFEEETYFGSDELYRHWMTNGDTEPGDVLITMEAPLGNIAQIPDDKRYILSQRVVLLRPHRGFLTKDFLALQMMGEQFQRELVRNSTGTTAVGIQRAKLELILVAVPRSMQEQQNIADTMHSLDSEISAASSELSKLQQLKSGLMTDLLTGRVRVPETVSSWEERA